MANFPLVQMPDEAVKFRFQEPFASEAANRKSVGIVPPGIYRGYDPNPQANFQLFINTDGVSNDSVAVVETPTPHYNLTVRHEQQLVLDFTGHATFPVFVVLRAAYSLTPHPFSGTTDVKLVTTQTVQPGDIRLCIVNGIGPFNVPIVDATPGTARDEVAGVVTQTQFADRMKIAVAEFPTFVSGNVTRTVVHNFGLTNITPIGGSQTLYQTDQGLVYVLPYVTGFGEFSDTSTDWAYMVIGALTANQFSLLQVNARQGCIQINIAVMLFVGVNGVAGGGTPPSPQIFVLPLTTPGARHNFGSVLVGNNSSILTVEVFNTGTLPLNVGTLVLPAPFFILFDGVGGTSIPPGGNGTVTVRFTPSAVGLALAQLQIPSDDPDTPVENVYLQGTGI